MNKKQILEIYREYRVPQSIIKHMQQVAKICAILSEKLQKKGHKIDKESLIYAALLHDVLRVSDIKNYNPHLLKHKVSQKDLEVWQKLRKKYQKIGHEKAIAKVLKSMGEIKLANLVLKHDFYLIDKLKTLEEKILYYADKRVDHDKIVTLKKRFKEGRKRNNDKEDDFSLISSIEKKIFKLEKEFK